MIHENIFKDKWQEILNNSRENYISTIKTLTNNQKEVEIVIKQVIKNYNNFTQKQIDNAFKFVSTSLLKREQYIELFKKNIYQSLEIIPSIEDIIFNKHFEEMNEIINSFYSDFFENKKN